MNEKAPLPKIGLSVKIEWNDLPMGREFDGNFFKNVKSPPHAPPPTPHRLYIDGCLKIVHFPVDFSLFIHVYLPSRFLHLQTRCSN